MNQSINWGDLLSSPVIVTLTTSVTAGLGWLGVKLYNYIKEKPSRLNKKLEKAYTDSLRSIAIVYSTILALEKQPEIDRVFLVELSNGGNKPRPGSKLSAKGIYIELDELKLKHSKQELLKRYEDVQVDDKYIMMCIEAQQNGRYIFNVENHSDCLLKSIYTREGIVYSEIFHIYTDHLAEKMFILSVATQDKKETYKSLQTRAYIETSVRLIKDNFKLYRK